MRLLLHEPLGALGSRALFDCYYKLIIFRVYFSDLKTAPDVAIFKKKITHGGLQLHVFT